MRTNELIGPALDWAVAKCEGFDTRNNYRCQVIDADGTEYVFECFADDDDHAEEQAKDAYPNSEVHLIEHISLFAPSIDWAQGGPIIEREVMALGIDDDMETHRAHYPFKQGVEDGTGPTPLIAAMRCHVASKLGDEVKTPEELK